MDLDTENEELLSECPICCKQFSRDSIETHVNRCIFLNATEEDTAKPKENKRTFSVFNANRSPSADSTKKPRKGGSSFSTKKPTAVTQRRSSTNVIQLSDDEAADQNVKMFSGKPYH